MKEIYAYWRQPFQRKIAGFCLALALTGCALNLLGCQPRRELPPTECIIETASDVTYDGYPAMELNVNCRGQHSRITVDARYRWVKFH